MRWYKPNLRSSLQALFSGGIYAPPEEAPDFTIDDIRQAMLGLMTGAETEQFPSVTRRIRYATDVQALWFLRGDLMAALASQRGESLARASLAQISEMFENSVPRGLRSRPSPLSENTGD